MCWQTWWIQTNTHTCSAAVSHVVCVQAAVYPHRKHISASVFSRRFSVRTRHHVRVCVREAELNSLVWIHFTLKRCVRGMQGKTPAETWSCVCFQSRFKHVVFCPSCIWVLIILDFFFKDKIYENLWIHNIKHHQKIWLRNVC